MLQPGASLRPVITKRAWTLPSGTPLLFLKRASRTGPFGAMNHGTVFFAPLSVATAIKAFCAGLVPPMFGCEWHEKHWFEVVQGGSNNGLGPRFNSNQCFSCHSQQDKGGTSPEQNALIADPSHSGAQ